MIPGFGHTLATARVTTASELLVGTAVVPLSTVRIRPMRGIDPDAGMHIVEVDTPPTGAAWTGAVALARRAIAHQVAGATRTMLALARQHALDRVQFGRPVAQFQAVRHRLAEALVAVEALDATLAAAAQDPGTETAALAKITAGQTARTVATHCQQVLAGIGFTTDHPFHRYLKRTLLLDGLFDGSDDLVLAIGHTLLAARRVPTLIEL
jgi:alkylation response protein AidB-like acyl-CoA dehydrogenase